MKKVTEQYPDDVEAWIELAGILEQSDVQVGWWLRVTTASLFKWRLSVPDIQELPLLAASSQLRLLPWLTNPDNSAISTPAGGTMGTGHTDIVYTVEKKEGRGGTAQKLCSNVEGHYKKHEGSTCKWTTEDC